MPARARGQDRPGVFDSCAGWTGTDQRRVHKPRSSGARYLTPATNDLSRHRCLQTHGCLPSRRSGRNTRMPHHRSSPSGQVGFISRPARCDPGCCDHFQGTEGANRCSSGQSQRPVAAVRVQLSFRSLIFSRAANFDSEVPALNRGELGTNP